MENIIDDFGKGIDLDQTKIVAYRSSQRVVSFKRGRNREKLGSSKGLL